MNKIFSILALSTLIICLSFSLTSELSWLTNLDSAKTTAANEDKVILLSFQGSDWCGNCMKLEKSLFESAEFKGYAEKELVLLKADFPMKKANKLSKELTAHNDDLASKFNKKGSFPLVIILNSQGEKIGEMTHPLPSTEDYLNNLKGILK